MLDTFNNLKSDNNNIDLLSDNNSINANINININLNTNSNKTIFNKNNNNLCKDEFKINIENLF